jgi:hypothetical protein
MAGVHVWTCAYVTLALTLALSGCVSATNGSSLLVGVPLSSRSLSFRGAGATSLEPGMFSGFTALTSL